MSVLIKHPHMGVRNEPRSLDHTTSLLQYITNTFEFGDAISSEQLINYLHCFFANCKLSTTGEHR